MTTAQPPDTAADRAETFFDAVALSPADNVATVLRAVAPGDRLTVRCGAQTLHLTVAQAVPFCHKISLRPIAQGEDILKYGSSIGQARAPISQGGHVHVHNIISHRARPGETGGPAPHA